MSGMVYLDLSRLWRLILLFDWIYPGMRAQKARPLPGLISYGLRP